MSNKVELKGNVINITEKSGDSAKGTWRRQNIVIRTDNSVKNEITVGFFNKDLDVKVGDNVTLTAFVGGREYQGKWYLDLDGDTLSVTGKAMTPSDVYQTAVVEDDDLSKLPF